ncbi:porin [Alcaligenaceae bacterium]|nr:porin [Alcaligenaceae bacterium]
MKKTLLAAALALGFAGVAQAETSVTLYGVLDGGIGYQQIKGDGFKARKTGMINGVQNGNRWGLRGTEDLGNGLQVVFQVESGFDLSTGQSQQGGRLFGRHATVGLQSDAWGRLDIGRQTNIGSKYFAAIDPFGAGFGQSNLGTTFGSVNTVRWDNMVMYQTPNFSGFQFGVGYSFNTDGAQRSSLDVNGVWDLNESDRNRRGITTGLRYANGPLAVALSYEQERIGSASGNGLTTPGDDVNVRSWQLGGAYDFEVVKVHAAFGQTRNGMFGAGVGSPDGNIPVSAAAAFGQLDGLKYNHYMVGLTAPVGAGKIFGSWQMADPRSNPDAAPNADLDKMNIYSLGYTYDLSKRTNLYVFGSYAKDVNFISGVKSTYAGVGMRHRF